MIDISVFKGENPKLSRKLLPDEYADSAINCDLQDGRLAPELSSTHVADLLSSTEAVYRMGEQWLQFDAPVEIIEDPTENDAGRIMISGPEYPQETDTATAITGDGPYPSASRLLGIPEPETALTYSVTVPGSGFDREVAYCYTRIGERIDGTVVESAPSPSTEVFTAKDDATVRLTGFADATADGVYTTAFRIYRINTGDTGAEFQFVDDVPKETSPLQYDDTVPDNDLGEVLPSGDWTAPVNHLRGFLVGPAGMVFAFKKNTLYVSDPYIPYAFPVKNSMTTPSEIVGIGFNGSAVVVLTKKEPALVYGSDPESLVIEKVPAVLPCKSMQSIVSMPSGVVFASAFGLYMIDSGGNATNLTRDIFTDRQWSELNPNSIFSFFYKGAYYAFFRGTDKGIEVVPGSREIRSFRTGSHVWGGRYVSTATTNAYEFLTSDSEPVLTSSNYPFYCMGTGESIMYDSLYLIRTKNIPEEYTDVGYYAESDYAVDRTAFTRELVAFCKGAAGAYSWTSKDFYLMRKHILTAGRVAGDFSSGDVTVSLHVDDSLFFSKKITSDKAFRIPKAAGSTFRVKLEGKTNIDRVVVGASISEVTQDA